MKAKPTFIQIREALSRGEDVEICRDDNVRRAVRDEIEGPWYITTGRVSFCYYRTRREAQAEIDLAKDI